MLLKENQTKLNKIKDLSKVINVENTIKSMQNLDKLVKMISIYEDNNILHSKMEKLLNEKTKELEKSLKNNTDTNLIKQLITS